MLKRKTEQQNQLNITKLINVKNKIEKRVVSNNSYNVEYNGSITNKQSVQKNLPLYFFRQSEASFQTPIL